MNTLSNEDLTRIAEAIEAARIFITPLERRRYAGDEYKEDAEKRLLEAANLLSGYMTKTPALY